MFRQKIVRTLTSPRFIRCGALLPLVWYLLLLYLPAVSVKPYALTIPRGGTVASLATELQGVGMLRSSFHFRLAARLRGLDRHLKAGDYLLLPSMKPVDILQKLALGQADSKKFTLPEGYSIYQAAELLDKSQLLSRTKFLDACHDPLLLKELQITAPSVEGYLFPDTYQIGFKTDEKTLIRDMVREFRRRIAQLDPQRDISGSSLKRLVILASLVEREAVVASEKPLIASVFLNRLRLGMPLQSDPTAVYGIKVFGGKVTGADVRRESAYNTYRIQGLPPGAIGNPGIDALKAVLRPAQTQYLYFVARKDGTHQFSQTLSEHNQAVTRYLKQ